MAKRKGKLTKLEHLTGLALASVIGYALWVPRYGLLPCLLLGVCILIFWVLFLMPTRCDFETRSGGSCHQPVNGKLRGCKRWHVRDKRDALYAALRMRNPGMAVRTTWIDGAQSGHRLGIPARGSTPTSYQAKRNHGQALFNLASLVVALVGSIAGVLALFVGH
ncbi:MAG TPA: hypothetical protein VGM60_12455 [Pseudonocardia sp.]|jgi:hypothetical protein|uniref:hypothetical protein n=1 Tax=Pseudonocardia sp. TaxID=60912 RepID=UPI002F3E3AA0